MYRLLEFLRSISHLLLFLVLESAALLYYAHSDSYTQAKIVGATANITGGVRSFVSDIDDYFSLQDKNDMLTERVISLQKELNQLKALHSDSLMMAYDTLAMDNREHIPARVVRNTTHKSHNFILINRGLSSGIRERMAVTTPRGEIVGSVIWCTDDYAVVISLLNIDFRSSGKIFGSNHAGGISWEGESRYYMQLTDLSKYAEPFEGALIVTTGLSQIFPEGLTIGHIVDYSLNELDGSYLAHIEIAADMSSLSDVIVIGSTKLNEEQAAMDLFEEQQQTN